MKTKNLLVASITGFSLFLYFIGINASPPLHAQILEIIKLIILLGFSIIIVDAISFSIVDIWFVRKTRKKPSDLLRFVVSIILYSICAFIIFRILGKDITALAATSALLGAILGFGLQSPLTNFLSGVLLQAHQPFQIGDYIALDGLGIQGVVSAIDWRTTVIQLDSGQIIYIPNAALSDNPICIIPESGSIYQTLDFIAPATAPPNQVVQVALHAIWNNLNPNLNPKKRPFVRPWSYGLGEIEYRLFYYPYSHQKAEARTNPELRSRLWYALGRAGFGSVETARNLDQEVGLISRLGFFQNLSLDAQKLIASQSRVFLFDHDESIYCPSLPSQSMLVVLQGTIEAEQKIRATEESTIIQAYSRRPRILPMAHIPEETIDEVAVKLAKYIGPAAFVITTQVAQSLSSVYWLYEALAEEIPDPDDRRLFLQSQPVSPTEQFRSGDVLGEMRLFLGQPWPRVNVSTLEETVVLAITLESVMEGVNHDQYDLESLSTAIAHHYDNYLQDTLQSLTNDSGSQSSIAARIYQYLRTKAG